MRRTKNSSQQHGDKLKRVGLARALSKLGFCSRAQAAEMIRAGRVRLNGAERRDPETPVHMGKDRVDVDGAAVRASEKIYLAMNKPRGVITTTADEKGRVTVYDVLGKQGPWLAPVGRLDKASEGLLLLTNDSEWAARVTVPEMHLDKTYHVQIGSLVDEALLENLRAGVVDDDETLRAKRVSILRHGEKNSWLEIVLDEGKNRQIRRMLEHFDLEVLRLIRVAIGPLALGDLAKGAHRELREVEKRLLDEAIERGNKEAKK